MVINQTEPTAQRIDATRKSAALVETITVERATYAPQIVVLGTVEAARDITLAPRVSGQVVEMSPMFLPGAMVKKGELLLRIDPADFENAVAVRESELAQAEASLEIELGRKALAENELSLLKDTVGDTNRALVLREPQITSIQAEIRAAKASIERAKLDLQRTTVTAPFDAQILSRSVNIGSQVGPGDNLGRLVGVEEYWIMAAVPVRSLPWLQFPEDDGEGSPVTIRNPNTWLPGAERVGQVSRMIGTLDGQTRLAQVLITVTDPLAKETDAPPLILDTLLEAHIEGRPIENVVRLRREFVHERDTVWVFHDGKLEIRDAEIVFRDATHAYIRSGLESGEEVVLTTLAMVAEGIGLKKINESMHPSEDSKQESTD